MVAVNDKRVLEIFFRKVTDNNNITNYNDNNNSELLYSALYDLHVSFITSGYYYAGHDITPSNSSTTRRRFESQLW